VIDHWGQGAASQSSGGRGRSLGKRGSLHPFWRGRGDRLGIMLTQDRLGSESEGGMGNAFGSGLVPLRVKDCPGRRDASWMAFD